MVTKTSQVSEFCFSILLFSGSTTKCIVFAAFITILLRHIPATLLEFFFCCWYAATYRYELCCLLGCNYFIEEISRYVKSKCHLLVLTNQSVALWCYFMPTVNDLRPNNSTVFLQAQSTLIHTNFKGERAPKKTRCFDQNFPTSVQKLA